jgi:hypothetical protein
MAPQKTFMFKARGRTPTAERRVLWFKLQEGKPGNQRTLNLKPSAAGGAAAKTIIGVACRHRRRFSVIQLVRA